MNTEIRLPERRPPRAFALSLLAAASLALAGPAFAGHALAALAYADPAPGSFPSSADASPGTLLSSGPLPSAQARTAPAGTAAPSRTAAPARTAAAEARAAGAPRTWSFAPAGARGTLPGTVAIREREVRVDLGALPAGSTVLRAILRLGREPPVARGGEDDAVAPLAVTAMWGHAGSGAATNVEGPEDPGAEPAGTRLPLRLRPPRYRDLDATGAVRAALAAGGAPEGRSGPEGAAGPAGPAGPPGPPGPAGPARAREVDFRVERFGGWVPGRTRLDVTFRPPAASGSASPEGPAPSGPAVSVSALRAWHSDGQTFLTWTQGGAAAADRTLPPEGATVADLREARSRAATGPEIRYRIYRSVSPIAPETVGEAELLDEVDGFTAWNDEFHGAEPRPESPVLRRVVRDGERPVPPGTGIYVHQAAAEGRAWYAVTAVEDGAEDFASPGGGASSAGPVEETVGAGRPVLQRTERPKEFQYVEGPVLEYYVRWESPPTANVPSRPFDYLVAIPPTPRSPAPLCVALHSWGGSLEGGYGWWYGARDGAMLVATNQIPYDWWAAYHESLGTLRPFTEGVVRSFTPQRVWSFVEWMRTRWEIDPARVFCGGSSMGGSGVSHWIRRGDRFAFGISWVGVHIPRDSPQFRGSYESCVGKAEWNLPHESGVPVFDHLDGARWLREHPEEETAFLAYANGKNDSAIGWMQAVEFTRALQETRRPHLFVWGQAGHGQRAYFPTAAGGGDNVEGMLDIRSDRSLPAFTRCSLDDPLGDGDPASGAPEGQINRYARWDPASVVDERGLWSAVIYLIEEAPEAEATLDLTPRRCRAFRPRPGTGLAWRILGSGGSDGADIRDIPDCPDIPGGSDGPGGLDGSGGSGGSGGSKGSAGSKGPDGPKGPRALAAGKAVADRHGLATLERLPIAKARRTIEIRTVE